MCTWFAKVSISKKLLKYNICLHSKARLLVINERMDIDKPKSMELCFVHLFKVLWWQKSYLISGLFCSWLHYTAVEAFWSYRYDNSDRNLYEFVPAACLKELIHVLRADHFNEKPSKSNLGRRKVLNLTGRGRLWALQMFYVSHC